MQDYEITDANGATYTVQLSDEDAKARGLKPTAETKSSAASNKARKPKNKSA